MVLLLIVLPVCFFAFVVGIRRYFFVAEGLEWRRFYFAAAFPVGLCL